MARELTPTDPRPLHAHLAIRADQANAVRNLITRLFPQHQAHYLAVLGLDHEDNQP